MENRNLSALHASYLSLRDWHVLLEFPINTEGIIENRDTTISLRMIEVATFSSNSRSLKLSNLVSGIAYGALLPGSESIL